ncbi:hypothetical protein F5878DRAFT_647748 [Lentinula raphanica]|uniref:Uncharacterized protein n=1 Tax=Lentinula raphanica TaxID=153919 RepID=A0AA38NVB9_9AGAR|nr:hypothetical protein F5878DRAFT_647748 [Lentinula raphanica]
MDRNPILATEVSGATVVDLKESRLNIAVVDFRSLLRPFLLVLGSMGPARELDISAVTASGSMGSAHALDTSASGALRGTGPARALETVVVTKAVLNDGSALTHQLLMSNGETLSSPVKSYFLSFYEFTSISSARDRQRVKEFTNGTIYVEHEGGQTKKYSAYANTEPNREEKHGDKTPNGIGKSEGRQKNEEANNFRWQIREHLRKYLSLSGGMQFVNTDQLRADDPWLPVEQIGAEVGSDGFVT